MLAIAEVHAFLIPLPLQAVKKYRLHLLAAAEEDLGKVKRQFFLQIAKDRGVLAEYLREIKARPCTHSLGFSGAACRVNECAIRARCAWVTLHKNQGALKMTCRNLAAFTQFQDRVGRLRSVTQQAGRQAHVQAMVHADKHAVLLFGEAFVSAVCLCVRPTCSCGWCFEACDDAGVCMSALLPGPLCLSPLPCAPSAPVLAKWEGRAAESRY